MRRMVGWGIVLAVLMASSADAKPLILNKPARAKPGRTVAFEIVAPDNARRCSVRFRRGRRTNGPYRVTLGGPSRTVRVKVSRRARGNWRVRLSCGASKREGSSLGWVEKTLRTGRKGGSRRLVTGHVRVRRGQIPPRPATTAAASVSSPAEIDVSSWPECTGAKYMQRAHKSGTGAASKVSFLPTARARFETLFPRDPNDYIDMWNELRKCINGFPSMTDSQLDRVYEQMVCHAWYAIDAHLGGDTWDFEAWYLPGDWDQALNPQYLCQNYPLDDDAANEFDGQIVQTTDDDRAAQKRAWLVQKAGGAYIRHHIPTAEIFGCLTSGGARLAGPLPAGFIKVFLSGIAADVPQSVCAKSGPAAAPRLSVTGSCTTQGGALSSTSSGFTPGAVAQISAWYPDGRPYTNLAGSSRVRADGTISWSWPCAGDPAGTYTTEVVDGVTGASTGKVSFYIAPAGGGSQQPPAHRIVTVDNRVTNGGGMREDATPTRLTTAPRAFCTSNGCNINGTERSTGGTYDEAVCQTRGERITNGNDHDASDDGNPERYESTLYYGVRLSNGTFGFVSEVWIRATDRGGLGLPAC